MHKTYTYSLIKNHCNAVVNTAMYVSNAAKHSVASLKEPTASAQKQAKVSCVDFCVFETEQKANIQVKSNSLKKRAKSTNTNGALHSPFLSLIFVYFLSRKSKKKDLTLKLVNFAGTTPNFSGYTFTWLLNGAPVGTNSHTITTNQPGTVSVSFSSTQSPNYVCDAEVDILAKPCISPNTPTSCGIPAILVPPTIVAASMPLAVGATFIAGGDYTVTITNISGSTASGYTGTGYVALKLYGPLALNRMAVDFENLKVDPCFAMAAGSLKSQYDPGWGGIVDVDGVVNDIKKLINNFQDLLISFEDTQVYKEKICENLTSLKTNILNDSQISNEKKENSIANLDLVNSVFNTECFTCGANTTARLEIQTCKIEKVNEAFDQFISAYNGKSGDCIVPSSFFPPTSNKKAGANIRYFRLGNFGSQGCIKHYYLFNNTTTPLLTQFNASNGKSISNGWTEEIVFTNFYDVLYKSVAKLSGRFSPAIVRTNSEMTFAKNLVNEFFNTYNETTLDTSFFKILSKEVKRYIEDENFRVTGTIEHHYIDFDILSLGTAAFYKRIANSFATSTFKIATEIGSGKVKQLVTKKIVANISSGKIIRSSSSKQTGKVVAKIENEIIDDVAQKNALIVKQKTGNLAILNWKEIFEDLLPKNSYAIQETYTANTNAFINNSKTISFSSGTNAQIKQTCINLADNNYELGHTIEDLIATELESLYGLTKVHAQSGTHGIDVLLVDDITNPTVVFIAEIKGTKNIGNAAKWKYGTAGPQSWRQMHDNWIQHVKTYFDPGTDAYEVLEKVRTAAVNNITVFKAGIFSDGDGIVRILKL